MKTWKEALLNRRVNAVLLLGFSSGIPLALTGATLQAWLTDAKVSLVDIGLFSLVGAPYGFKFLWAPFMDRFVPPLFGRRRGWLIVTQVLTALAIAMMALLDPAEHRFALALGAFLVAFFSASQDIVVDAYRTDVLEPEERGPGAAYYITGYRIAMLISGAVALALAEHIPWRTVYLLMAATMGIGVLATLIAPEPKTPPAAPRSLTEAVVQPFFEFFKRRGAIEVLLFIVLYKLDVIIATALTTPFMMSLGFSKDEIAAVTKVFGMIATIAGTMAGGVLMVKLGMRRALLYFGIAQGISGFTFAMLAHAGKDHALMVASIAAENFFSGMGTAAFSAFLMSLCDPRFTATQYALLTSFMAQSRVVGSAPSGWLAQTLGWENYFYLSILVSIPGLMMLMRYSKWSRGQSGD